MHFLSTDRAENEQVYYCFRMYFHRIKYISAKGKAFALPLIVLIIIILDLMVTANLLI